MRKLSWAVTAGSAILCSNLSMAHCAPMGPAPQAAVATIDKMFAALTTADLAALQAQVTPDFYAFDRGQRYDAAAIVALIKALHAGGTQIQWSVHEPEVHVSCDLAWVR